MTVLPRSEQRQAQRRALRDLDPEGYSRKNADALMRSRFKRSLDDYERVLAEQGGHCASCSWTEGQNGRRLSWDHDHGCCPGRNSCGDCVRGLLCNNCNYLAATFENEELRHRTEGVINYLTNWREQ